MKPLVYLTGVPAAGKSTLVAELKRRYESVAVIEYSTLLCEHLGQKHNRNIEVRELRELSGELITPEDVRALDELLVTKCHALRDHTACVIVSHAVTREPYGFRMVALPPRLLVELRLSAVCVLICSATDAVSRSVGGEGGRPKISERQAELHADAQMSLAVNYAFMAGCPLHVVEPAPACDPVEILARLLI